MSNNINKKAATFKVTALFLCFKKLLVRYLWQLHLGPHLPSEHLQTPLTQQFPGQVHLPSLQQAPLAQTQDFLTQQPVLAACTEELKTKVDKIKTKI
jgi:hypothetical protein